MQKSNRTDKQKEEAKQKQSQFEDTVKMESSQQDSIIKTDDLAINNAVHDHHKKNIKQDSTTLTDLSFNCLVKPQKIEDNNPKSNTQTNLTVTIQTEQKISPELETKIKNAANLEGKILSLLETELNLELLDEAKDNLKSNVQNELGLIKTTDTIVETKSKILSPDVLEKKDKNLQSKDKKVFEKIDKEAENKRESYHVNINQENIEQFKVENDLESEIKVNNKVTTEFNEQDNNIDINLPASITEKDLTVEHKLVLDAHNMIESIESVKLNLQNVDKNDSKHHDIQVSSVVSRPKDLQTHKKYPLSRVIQHHEELSQCLSARHENRCRRNNDCVSTSKNIPVTDISRPRCRRSLETIRQREVMNNGPAFIENGWMGNDTPCNYSTANKEFFRREVTRPRTLAQPPAVFRTGCGYSNNTQKYESTTKATYRDPEKLYAEEREKKLTTNISNQDSYEQ